MIRQTKHILKYQTESKNNILDRLFDDYLSDLKSYIQLIVEGNLPLKQFLSSKDCPNLLISHANWKGLIYKQASAIVRSQLKRSEDRRYKRYKQLYAKAKESRKFINFTEKKYSELKLKSIIKTKFFTIPNIKSLIIELPTDRFDIQKGNSFDKWIKINTPYVKEGRRKGISIKLPIKQYEYTKKI